MRIGVGGPLALLWGAAAGAVVGYGLLVLIDLLGRRALRGPVTPANAELWDTVVELVWVERAASAIRDADDRRSTMAMAQRLMWQLCSWSTSEGEYRRLRYQAYQLARAVHGQGTAQRVLDAATSTGGVRGGVNPAVNGLLSSSEDLTARLTARASALHEVTDQLAAHRAHPGAVPR